MLDDNPLLAFSLILLGLVVGPWILWYLYARTVTWIQRKLLMRELKESYKYVSEFDPDWLQRRITSYNPETKVATIKNWPPKDK